MPPTTTKFPSIAIALVFVVVTRLLLASTLAFSPSTSYCYRGPFTLAQTANNSLKTRCIDDQFQLISHDKKYDKRLTRINLLKWPENGSIDSSQKYMDFFIRDADFADLGKAAKILTDGFFAENTNFITYSIERLKTFLSLESTFPGVGDGGLRSMIVACRYEDGLVLGFAELDCRPKTKSEEKDPTIAPRPYMYNLAVDKRWKRKGIATALIKLCEERTLQCNREVMYLKVKEGNEAAILLYQKAGYEVVSSGGELPDGTKVSLMKKELVPVPSAEVTEEVKMTQLQQG